MFHKNDRTTSVCRKTLCIASQSLAKDTENHIQDKCEHLYVFQLHQGVGMGRNWKHPPINHSNPKQVPKLTLVLNGILYLYLLSS